MRTGVKQSCLSMFTQPLMELYTVAERRPKSSSMRPKFHGGTTTSNQDWTTWLLKIKTCFSLSFWTAVGRGKTKIQEAGERKRSKL